MDWYTIDKQVDKIDENGLNPDLKLRINRFTKFFLSNIFGRALSYLVGWTGTQAKMLRCTTAGILKVALTGSGYEHNSTFTGTSANAYVNIWTGTTLYSTVDIWIKTNDVTIRRYKDTITWDSEIPLEAGDFYSFDCVTGQLALKSTVAGVHGTYKIIAWR